MPRIADQDLTPIPDPDAPLTEEELGYIRNMEPEWALEFATEIIANAVRVLGTQSNEHEAAARVNGFECAEHEVLAFLASDWFDLLITRIQGASPGTGPRMSALEYAQHIVDEALGPGVLTVVKCKSTSIPRRKPDQRKRRGFKFVRRLSATAESGEELLGVYSNLILAEGLDPKCIIIEIPLGEGCYA